MGTYSCTKWNNASYLWSNIFKHTPLFSLTWAPTTSQQKQHTIEKGENVNLWIIHHHVGTRDSPKQTQNTADAYFQTELKVSSETITNKKLWRHQKAGTRLVGGREAKRAKSTNSQRRNRWKHRLQLCNTQHVIWLVMKCSCRLTVLVNTCTCHYRNYKGVVVMVLTEAMSLPNRYMPYEQFTLCRFTFSLPWPVQHSTWVWHTHTHTQSQSVKYECWTSKSASHPGATGSQADMSEYVRMFMKNHRFRLNIWDQLTHNSVFSGCAFPSKFKF